MNLGLNLTDLSGQSPGFVYQAPPMCVQEYAVRTALRMGWVLFIFLLLFIVYQGKLRPVVARKFGEEWARGIDKGLLIAMAGIAGVLVQALRTVAG